MKRRLIHYIFFTLLLSAVATASSAAQVAYQATVLRDLSGNPASRAYCINNSGVVIGSGYNGTFIWDPSNGMRDVGMGVSRINNSNQMLGNTSAHYPNLSDFARPYILKNGTVTTISISAGCTWGYDINDYGYIVGRSLDGEVDMLQSPFIYDNNGYRTLPTPYNGLGEASVINNNSRVGGVVNDHAYLWLENGSHGYLTLPGEVTSEITGINNLGRVVGTCRGNGWSYAFYANGIGTMHTITSMYSASDINNKGQVIGRSISDKACLWDPNNGLFELPLPVGYTRGYAYSINESGWIAGYCYDAQYRSAAVLWAPVPEPSCILALLSGCAALAGFARRRK